MRQQLQGLPSPGCKEKGRVPHHVFKLKINKMNLDMKVSFNIISKTISTFCQIHLSNSFNTITYCSLARPMGQTVAFLYGEGKRAGAAAGTFKSETRIILLCSRNARITKLPLKFDCFPTKSQMG